MARTDDEKLGFQADRDVVIKARIWEALRRMVLRMTQSFGYIEREALALMASCRHADGCEAPGDHSVPCRHDCPDRERWLSANLCLQNARIYIGQVNLPSKLAASYTPPTREYFDRIVAELEALRAARDWLAEVEIMGARPEDMALLEPLPQPRTRLLAPSSFDELEPEERAAMMRPQSDDSDDGDGLADEQ